MINTSSKILDVVREQIEKRYGKTLEELGEIIAQDGMDVIGFGAAYIGDVFFRVDTCKPHKVTLPVNNVLLLHPKPRRRILLEETGEVRKAQPGEYGVSQNDKIPNPWPDGSICNVSIWKARKIAPGEGVR